MKKIFEIASWEFKQKVKRKSFIASLLITPAILFLLAGIPTLLSDGPQEQTLVIGIIEAQPQIQKQLRDELSEIETRSGQPGFLLINLFNKNLTLEKNVHNAKQDMAAGKVNAFIYLNSTQGVNQYFSGNIDERTSNEIIQKTNRLLRNFILSKAGIPESLQLEINKVKLEKASVNNSHNDSDLLINSFLTSFFFVLLLSLTSIFSGGMMIRSLLEEKQNKLLDVLLTSVKHNQLLSGKWIGLVLLGLLQTIIWTGIAVLFNNKFQLINLSFETLLLIVTYFIVGYALFSSIFISAGPFVNSEFEANQITGYMGIVTVIPIVLSFEIIYSPDSFLSNFITYFPLTSPSSMMIRLVQGYASQTQIIISLVLLILFCIIIIFVASKVFRVMIDKPDFEKATSFRKRKK